MGVYSSYEVYPSWVDEIDTSLCENCPYADGICWKMGYCIVEEMD